MFESNDTFVEDSVKVVETAQDKTRKLGLMAMCLVSLGGFTVMNNHLKYIFLIVFIVMMIIDLILIVNNKNVEYEYDYTNGSLSIAKIIDNSKRKELLTVESAQLKMVAAMGTNESLKYDHVKLKTYDCSAHNEELKDYILVAHNEEKGYDFKVLFTPSDKLLTAMERYNKRDIYRG
ncbi:hypothetical protein SAMN02910298_02289 [Pseudobutyrivibrio sp. YE44]|uniref:DUF6106 family protein n=1 Tax=Pseudobutyrivibrio sp. YE44 TaxID=1520802 RepID=UPI000884DBA3|nr:DUF6106 family protein [Pseudobutyrivibrio sp. YE44]SDB45563.1 hypothetical protein SAMN02910298_02289 [Pseudobutyrivibrio sp. YE44]